MQIQHFVSFAISILAVNLAGNAAYSLINVDCICKVLAEGEEVSDWIHREAKQGNANGINHVSLSIVFEGPFNKLEDGYHEALPDIEHRERGVVVIEFKTQNLLTMGINTTVLQAPEEWHDPSKCIPFFSEDVTEWDASHYKDNAQVNECR